MAISQGSIGRYQIGQVLGRGGMGEVFAATGDDGRPLAIKVLKSEFSTNPKFIARFLQEQQILRSFDHPNLVHIEDVIITDEAIAIVMERIDGGDLRKALQDAGGRFTPEQTFALGAQILDALDVVHRAGVVHRDVKPENILVTRNSSGELIAKLSDFGVARMFEESAGFTTHTSLIGTPFYMAPELLEARRPTPAADLYSVGCMLYELLTSTPPFTGSIISVVRRHAEEAPAPIEGLIPTGWHVLDQLLAKNPADRPATASFAAAQLRNVASQVSDHDTIPLTTTGSAPTISMTEPRLSDETVPRPRVGPVRAIEPKPAVAASADRGRPAILLMIALSVVALIGAGTAIALTRGGNGESGDVAQPPPSANVAGQSVRNSTTPGTGSATTSEATTTSPPVTSIISTPAGTTIIFVPQPTQATTIPQSTTGPATTAAPGTTAPGTTVPGTTAPGTTAPPPASSGTTTTTTTTTRPPVSPPTPPSDHRWSMFYSNPFSPTGVYGTDLANTITTVDLSWNDNSDNEDGFRVTRFASGPLCANPGEQTLAEVGANVTAIRVSVKSIEYYLPGQQSSGCLLRLYVYALKSGFAPQRANDHFAVIHMAAPNAPTITSYTRSAAGGVATVTLAPANGWVTHQFAVDSIGNLLAPVNPSGTTYTLNIPAGLAAQCITVFAMNTGTADGNAIAQSNQACSPT